MFKCKVMVKWKEYLEHCDRKLERHMNDKNITLPTLCKLSKLPVSPEILQESRILKTLEYLSKRSDEVGEKALHVYNKWKALIHSKGKNSDSTNELNSSTPVNKLTNHKYGLENYVSVSKPVVSNSEFNTVNLSKPDSSMTVGSARETANNEKPTSVHKIHHENTFTAPKHAYTPSLSSSSKSNIPFNAKPDFKQSYVPHSSSKDSLSSHHNAHTYQESKHHESVIKNDENLNFDPNLTITHSSSSNATTDSPTKGRIFEPYYIEMKEGMFRVVKVKPEENMHPYASKFRELYQKAFMKNSAYRNDRENSNLKANSQSRGERSPVFYMNDDDDFSAGDDGAKTETKSNSYPQKNSLDREVKNGICESNDESMDITDDSKVNSSDKHSKLKSDFSECEQHKSEQMDWKSLGKKKKEKNSPKPDKIKNIEKSNAKSISNNHQVMEPRNSTSDLQRKSSPYKSCDKISADKKVLTDEAAVKYTSSKKERTSVYSGKRRLQEVLTLRAYCIQALRKNIDSLRYLNKVPYESLRSILKSCSPGQLRRLEDYNKYLLKSTDELWKMHCQRDYREHQPAENMTWRHLYWTLHEKQRQKLKNVTASISASMSKCRPERQTKLTAPESSLKRQSPKQIKLISSNEEKPVKSSKSETKASKLATPPKKSARKESEAPLMSKVKKCMGIVSKYKK